MAEAKAHWYRRRWPRVLLSIALLAVLASTVDFDLARWRDSAQSVLWWPIVAALLLRPVAVLTNAWHAKVLLESAGAGLSVRDVWRAFMFGELLSRFVPGNLGTMAYVAKLSNRLGDAFIAQLLDRILFLLVTLLGAAASLLLAGHALLALGALAAFAGAGTLAALTQGGIVRWRALSEAHRNTLGRVLRSRKSWLGPYATASVLSLALMTVLFWLLVVACGGSIGVFEALAAVTLVTIGTALPVTINGIGVREWVFVALLGDNLPSKEAVVTLAATTYVVGFASALLGVMAWALMRQKSVSEGAQG